MRTARLLAGSVRAMGRYRLRTAFMVLGSVVGVAALTLVVAIGRGAERKVLETVRQLFGETSIIVVTGGGTLLGGPRAGAARLTLEDVEAVVGELPDVTAWDAQQGLGSVPVKRGDATTTARVIGETERWERVWSRGVAQGESIDAAAVAGSARVALIGETVARELFGEEDPIGAEILVGSVSLRVVGLLERFGTDLHGMDRDAEVVVPLTTAMRRLMNVDTITTAKLLVRDRDRVAETAREVRRILRERHALTGDQPSDFTLITAIQVQKMVDKTRRVLFVFLPLVAAVALLAGAAVAAALMLASVSQRVGEIGVRRAVGARSGDIGLQFLLEAAVTTLAGGVLGLALGYAGAFLAARKLHLEGVFSWKALALGLAVSAAAGLLAGVLPARRAARLAPVDALRQ